MVECGGLAFRSDVVGWPRGMDGNGGKEAGNCLLRVRGRDGQTWRNRIRRIRRRCIRRAKARWRNGKREVDLWCRSVVQGTFWGGEARSRVKDMQTKREMPERGTGREQYKEAKSWDGREAGKGRKSRLEGRPAKVKEGGSKTKLKEDYHSSSGYHVLGLGRLFLEINSVIGLGYAGVVHGNTVGRRHQPRGTGGLACSTTSTSGQCAKSLVGRVQWDTVGRQFPHRCNVGVGSRVRVGKRVGVTHELEGYTKEKGGSVQYIAEGEREERRVKEEGKNTVSEG